MVLLFGTAAGVPLKVSLRVCVEAIVGFYSRERMWVRLLAGYSALWSLFSMEFLSGCFQVFCFSAAVFPLWCMYVVTRWWSKQWDWLQVCSMDESGVYETAGGAKRCRAEETTQLSLSSPAVLCLFVFYGFRCAPVSYCQIYYRSFIVWRSPICMPNTQTLMLLLQAERCICMYEAAISSFLNSPNSRSRPMRCTLHTCNNMQRIFLGNFMHAALLYGELGENLKESLREVIIKAFCLTSWSKLLSMKQGSLFCFVLSRWDLPNHGTSCHALGIFRKL